MAEFLGKNGSGKTTFFDAFDFLHDCLNGNVKSALGRGGYSEVVSRDHNGEDISFTVKYRPGRNEPLMTYDLSVVAKHIHDNCPDVFADIMPAHTTPSPLVYS